MPRDWNAKLNWPLGWITPESQAPPLAVDVWAVLSLFLHITVVPTEMFRGFGAYAVVVSVDAPLTMLALVLEPEGKGIGAGDGAGDVLLPHPMETVKTIMAMVIRSDRLSSWYAHGAESA